MKLTEKQKNCPYCHDRANLLQSNDERPIDGDIVYINKDGYLNSETDDVMYTAKSNTAQCAAVP